VLAGLVVGAGPGAAKVLSTTGVAERIAWISRLEALGAGDVTIFAQRHPENPLPMPFLLADAPEARKSGDGEQRSVLISRSSSSGTARRQLAR